MRKKWLRAMLWLTGIFLAMILVFAAVLYTNRDEITRSVVTEINSLLEAPVKVGNIEVSLIKFPLASLKFEEVYCSGANGTEADTLLYADEMYFEFHLWKVLFDDLSIDRISFNKGTVNILIPKEDRPNYEIWKSDTTQQSSGLFTLEKVYFQDFKLHISHSSSEFKSYSKIDNLSFSGSFDTDNYEIESSTGFFMDSLLVGPTTYLAQSPVSGSFHITGKEDHILISNGSAQVNGIPVNFRSDILPENVIVEAHHEAFNLKDLLDLTRAQKWADIPRELRLSGKGKIHFKGNFPDEDPMELWTSFKTEGASFSGYSTGKITGLGITGTYSLKNDKDELVISNFSGNGNTGSISGALKINDLSRPYLTLDLKGNLALGEWLIFVPLDTVQQASGRAVVNLHLENRFGSLSDIQPAELKRSRANGNFSLEDISFTFKDSEKRIEDLQADLVFNDNDLKVNSLFFRTGQSDIYLQGIFGNVLNYIFFDDEKLLVKTSLRSQEVVMTDFIAASGSSSVDEESYNLDFVSSLDLELSLEVDKFSFETFDASDISGQLLVKEGIIKCRSLKMDADKGTFTGNFSIDTRPKSHYNLSAGLIARNVDMHDLFLSFNNFGQEEIVAENIYGTANSEMRMTALMQRNLEIDPASVSLTAQLEIAEGNLKNYEPMMALSRFAHIDELQDVHFDRLQNQISIENSEIIIPQMDISSNILNLAISGRHSFENNVDYSMRLKLSDVLFNRRKNKNSTSEFDQHLVEVKNGDDPNIFIKMSGPAGDPDISLDRKNLNRSINDDLKQQGEELKNIFSKKKEDKTKNSSGIKYDLFGEDDKDPDQK